MWHMKSFAIFFSFFWKVDKINFTFTEYIYIYIFYLGKLRDIMRVMGNWMNHVDSL